VEWGIRSGLMTLMTEEEEEQFVTARQITLWPNSSVSKSPTRGAGWGDGREPFHLFRYLDEQAFRFNERKDTDAGRFVKAKASVTNDLYRDKVFSWTPNLPSQPHSSGSMRSPVK